MKLALPAAALLVAITATAPARAQAPAGPQPADIVKYRSIKDDPKRVEAAAKAGAKVASFCANCHGDGGNSSKPDVPNLAGQHPEYLMVVMHQYADGKRQHSEFKQRLLKVLSVDERLNMALFYAAQPVISKPARDAAAAKRGKDLYEKNCVDCHEESGRGTEKYARVAGQQPEYMTVALKAYRDGKRNKLSRQMAVSVEGMTDAELAALSTYIASMK
jgi:cytochrome c553